MNIPSEDDSLTSWDEDHSIISGHLALQEDLNTACQGVSMKPLGNTTASLRTPNQTSGHCLFS